MNLYAIAVWNVGGFAMLLYAESKSPECLPEKLKVDMKIVLFSMALIAAVFLISVMWAGGTAYFFHLKFFKGFQQNIPLWNQFRNRESI